MITKILSYLSIEELLTKTNRTCKTFNNIISNTSYLWRDFEFDHPIQFTEGTLEQIFPHSRAFVNFVVPLSGYINYCVPDIDYVFTKYFDGCKLYCLNISECPISTLSFLKQCVNLEILLLDGCKNLLEVDFLAVKYCNKLDHLYVSFTSILPRTIIKILQQKNLTVLDACGVHFTMQECFAVMQLCKYLLFFHLSLKDVSSAIRRQFKSDFIDIYRNCKIIQVSASDVHDFQTASTCFKYCCVPFTKVKCIKLTSELPMHVQYKLSFNEPNFNIVYLVRQTRSGNTIGIDKTPYIHLLKTKPKISVGKSKDLESMLKFMPDIDKQYLENLCKIGRCRPKRLFPESTTAYQGCKKMKTCKK